tara:strand:- start:556 stop:1149 length:594 start_codon:yes stop_codon:yes gene_type:complete
MAQKQFNDWDPTKAGLEGNMMAEPRVFAHDAVAITIGAINCSDANYGIQITDPGEDFVVGETVDLTHGGTDATLTVLSIDTDNNDAIVNYKIECDDAGDGYEVGDTLAALTGSAAGNGVDITITNIDIPNTQKRGCCIYNGSAAAQNITVVMEAETYDGSTGTGYSKTVTWPNVPSGAVMPMQVVQVTLGTNLLAIY